MPSLDLASEVAIKLGVGKIPPWAHLKLRIILEETVEAVDADTAFEADKLGGPLGGLI